MDNDVQSLVQNYLRALADPTRASLLTELADGDELTATQMARRLGLTVNNVYHHLRKLNQWGLLATPRVVPGPTYVEKYYRLQPALTVVVQDPGWLDKAQKGRTAAERQAIWVAFCAQLAQLMMRAANHYAAMTPEEWEQTVLTTRAGMMSLRKPDPKRYREDLEAFRSRVVLPSPGEDSPTGQDVLVIAALPGLFQKRSHESPEQ